MESNLIFKVIDEGIGIKEEDWPKLFKPFGKLEDGQLYNPTGTGLGLSICKDVLQQLGGEIYIEQSIVTPKEDSGTVFVFTIQCFPLNY